MPELSKKYLNKKMFLMIITVISISIIGVMMAFMRASSGETEIRSNEFLSFPMLFSGVWIIALLSASKVVSGRFWGFRKAHSNELSYNVINYILGGVIVIMVGYIAAWMVENYFETVQADKFREAMRATMPAYIIYGAILSFGLPCNKKTRNSGDLLS